MNANSFNDISKITVSIGRVGPQGVALLGTGFLIHKEGCFVTTKHVVGNNDQNLVVVLPKAQEISAYQDTTDNSVKTCPASVLKVDPFRDICILQTSLKWFSKFPITGTDFVGISELVAIFGFPHANNGRMVLTYQATEIGAKILLQAGPVKSKHVVINIQARPGQSGSPIISQRDNSIVAMVIGAYVPTGPDGSRGVILLGDIDPSTLHQTTHAVSTEYIEAMIDG